MVEKELRPRFVRDPAIKGFWIEKSCPAASAEANTARTIVIVTESDQGQARQGRN